MLIQHCNLADLYKIDTKSIRHVHIVDKGRLKISPFPAVYTSVQEYNMYKLTNVQVPTIMYSVSAKCISLLV